jgi:alkylation response protein AidB-like acyl-CoA dehydrogenase
MNFGFSEEQELLRDSAKKFLAAECPTTFVREMAQSDTAHSVELWKKIAELGWLGLLIPQRFGGMGGTLLDAAVILEEAGRVLLPGPFFSTVLLGAAALSAGGSMAQRKALLPRVAAGSLLVALAVLEPSGRYGAPGIALEAKRKRGDFVLRGEKVFVFDAGVADWIVVAARTARRGGSPERGVTLFLVERDAPGLSITALRTVDTTRRPANLSFDRVSVPGEQVLGRVGGAWPILEHVLRAATAGLCVETVGAAQQALDLSVRHALERRQFGRPIGSFQAVKHKCVDMMVAVENARSLAYHAVWAAGGRLREAARSVAMAKAYVSDMGKNVTSDAIQLHGGTGFTWEHDIHLYYRRALANEVTFGSAPLHREAVARELAL